MRRNNRIASIAAMVMLAFTSVATAFAQVHPIDDVMPHRPVIRQSPGIPVVPRATPSVQATATPAPRTVAPGRSTMVADQNTLGPKLPMSVLHLPALAPRTDRNSLYRTGGGIHTMSALPNSIQYSTGANCGATAGYIFNTGCTISFKMSYCDYSLSNTPCYSPNNSLSMSDTYQDYYIDANTATASTIGTTYVPNSCCSGTSYGPSHNLTLNNTGTVVLASYDTTTGQWVSIVYITVANASGLNAFSDATRLSPQTSYASGATAYFSGEGYGVNNSDTYAVYIESTSTNVSCVANIPGGTTGSGPCNPTTAAATLKATLNSNGVYAVNAQWTVTGTPGTYSVVLWDVTAKTRLAQTQIAIVSTGTVTIGFTPIAGNPSPLPAATPGSRFAFNNTSDQADKGITIGLTGLSGTDYYCFTITDPQGRVYQDVAASNFSYSCGTLGGGTTLNMNDTFLNYKSPVNFASNTYTVTAYDYNSGSVVAARAFQLLGYNATTQFTNAAGTATTGTSILLPKNSTATGGLQFANDGDAYYGTGNGDTLSGIWFDTGSNGVTFNCTATCPTTVTDTAGVVWTLTITQHGGGSNAGTTLLLQPQTAGTSLARNATVTVPNLTFNNAPGSSGCTTSCTGTTSILPTDGNSWSTQGSTAATNAVFFTNGNNTTYAGTTDFTHLGITTVGSPYTVGAKTGEEDHGFYPRNSQALYNVNNPFGAPANTYTDVYSMTVTNNSSAGKTIKGIAIYWPTNYSPGSYGVKGTVDGNSPTQWTLDTTTCPVSATAGFCIKPTGTNAGVAAGGSQQIYVDLQNLPALSFSYTDFNIEAYSPATFALTPSGTNTVYVDQSLTTVDNTAVAAYSLDSSLMSAYFTPTSEGTNTNNPVSITVQNTSSSQDPFPDYLDAIVIELPSGKLNTGTITALTSGWLYLNSSAGLAPGTTDYWFGLCSAQFNAADGPVQNPPPVNPSLPVCTPTATTESAYSIKPGAQFSFTGNITTGASAGTITGTMYAHGANGNGWTKGKNFNLSVTTVAATAGFVKDGTYGSPSSIPTNTTPQIGADSSTTYGNSFVYEIANTSGAGNNVTSATITIPHADTSAVADTTTAGLWTITAAPTLSGSGYTNCGVTSYTNPTTTTDGSIVIGNSGGTCTLTPNGKIDVSFPMKAPYKPNDSWIFSTKVNGAINAAENWTGDTYMNTIVSAQLGIVVWPGAGPGGAAPSPSCTRVCSYTQATNTLNMGAIANTQNNTGTDVVLVSVYTNAASPVGWHLYVSTNNNPANTGSPTNELLTDLDNTVGRQPSYGGVTLNQTALGIIPTSSPGMTLVTASGTSATRTPYDFLQNMQVNIQGGPVTAQTSTVTYTWISN